LTQLDIDGGTDIGAAIVDADLFIIDDGAGGTNRKTAASRLKTYVGRGLQNFVSTSTGAVSTATTIFDIGDSIPQNDEGDELFTLAITPDNSSNTLIIEATVNWSVNGVQRSIGIALFQDSTANALASAYSQKYTSASPNVITMTHVMAAGTTSSTTFKLRVGPNGDTLTINGESGTRRLGGVASTSFRIWEVTV
jgi:hypothetical protein